MNKYCIVTPSTGKYSETFIKNQIDFLPQQKEIITLSNGDFAKEDGVKLSSSNLLIKGLRVLERKLLKRDFFYQQNRVFQRFLKEKEVSHVLFQYGTTATKGYKACVDLNISFSVHFHGYDAYVKNYDQAYYSNVFYHATNLIVVSQHMRDRIVSLGADPKKVHIVPYGTDFNQVMGSFQVDDSVGDYLLAVGRFVEKKAPYLTILAFHQALLESPSLNLKMAGDGPLLPVCKDIVKGLGIEHHVQFLGAIPHDQVRSLMLSCRVFIQHSKVASNGDSEGLPNAIIEALSLGKPVVSTYHSGIPEIVISGENGFLSNEGDIKQMAKNILSALKLVPSTSNEFIRKHSLEFSIAKLNEVIRSHNV